MKKLIFAIVIFCSCNIQPKKSDITISDSTSVEVLQDQQQPAAKYCKSDLGVLKMDIKGYSKGKKTELTELRRFLNNNDCDIIEITYELKGSYGDKISKLIIYNKREMILKDIYTTNNVKEIYRGVSPERFKTFFEKGEKSFYFFGDPE